MKKYFLYLYFLLLVSCNQKKELRNCDYIVYKKAFINGRERYGDQNFEVHKFLHDTIILQNDGDHGWVFQEIKISIANPDTVSYHFRTDIEDTVIFLPVKSMTISNEKNYILGEIEIVDSIGQIELHIKGCFMAEKKL